MEQPEVEAEKPAPIMGANETGRASGATGYLLTEEMVGFVIASDRRGTTDSSNDEGVGSLRGRPLRVLACHRPGHTRTASGTGRALDRNRGARAGACALRSARGGVQQTKRHAPHHEEGRVGAHTL